MGETDEMPMHRSPNERNLETTIDGFVCTELST